MLVAVARRALHHGDCPTSGEFLCLSWAGAQRWLALVPEFGAWVAAADAERREARHARRQRCAPDTPDASSGGTVTGYESEQQA